MATFEKRRRSWRVKVRRAGLPTQTHTFDSKAEAATWARQIESEIDRGAFVSRVEAERTTLAAALERYEREVTSAKKGAAQERVRVKQWKNHHLARRSLAAIRGVDIASYRDARLAEGLSGSTVRLELALISHLYTIAAQEWGMEGLANPVRAVRKPKPGRARDRRLEEDEEERLLQAARQNSLPWLAPAIQIALETAMRLGEILALTWRDVNFSARVARLRYTKSGEGRSVPLSLRAIGVLEAMSRAIDGRVFPVKPFTLEHAFRRACNVAHIKNFRFHDLRHEATSRLFEKDLDTMEVAAITGHKTLQMLKRYTHLRARLSLIKTSSA